MLTVELKKLLDRVGLGWIIRSQGEPETLALSQLDPITLSGNFDLGFALGEYSTSAGAKRKKTHVGELLYRFKYQQDRQAGFALANVASGFINSRIELNSCELMITVPPSYASRPFDPVSFVAEQIERSTRIRWERDALNRTRLAKPQKELRQMDVKQTKVLEAYRLARPLDLSGSKVLLVDDLYDSGATLDQISGILREARARKINALVLAKSQGFGKVGLSPKSA